MRIGIDASSLMPPRTGIGNYTWRLVQALPELNPNVEYRLFLNSLRRPVPEEVQGLAGDNLRIRRRRIPGPWLHYCWKRWQGPSWEFLAGPADVVHAPASILPPTRKARRVLTLHDCYFMRRPEHCHRLGGLYMRETLAGHINECDAVICVSDFTRSEAIELLGLDPRKAHVVHSGVDGDLFRPVPEPECMEHLNKNFLLPLDYILTVATIEPRKNLSGLFSSYAQLRKIMDHSPQLVCVGDEGFQTEETFEVLDKLGLRDHVFFTGYVDNYQLPFLYNMAALVAIPSIYEGFGLPLLEAMSCGAPLVVSDIPPFREVGGDGAVYAGVNDHAAWAQSMRRILESEGEKIELRRKGMARAALFNWRNTARQTLAVYEQLIG
ncbi:MAG: glycosyltransferase family 4 protein [Candidatus Sumerlaeia bacterium]